MGSLDAVPSFGSLVCFKVNTLGFIAVYLMNNPKLFLRGLFTCFQETSVHEISQRFPFDQEFPFECQEIPLANDAAFSEFS